MSDEGLERTILTHEEVEQEKRALRRGIVEDAFRDD